MTYFINKLNRKPDRFDIVYTLDGNKNRFDILNERLTMVLVTHKPIGPWMKLNNSRNVVCYPRILLDLVIGHFEDYEIKYYKSKGLLKRSVNYKDKLIIFENYDGYTDRSYEYYPAESEILELFKDLDRPINDNLDLHIIAQNRHLLDLTNTEVFKDIKTLAKDILRRKALLCNGVDFDITFVF